MTGDVLQNQVEHAAFCFGKNIIRTLSARYFQKLNNSLNNASPCFSYKNLKINASIF